MSKRDLKRAEILDFITKMVTEEGYVPSVREICKAVDLSSPATVHYHLNLLNEDGLILKEPNKKRFIKLSTPITNNFIRVPVVGKITAGAPILAQENIEEYILIPSVKVKASDVFGLNVKGDSMIKAGIQSGDILIIAKTNIADNGDIVVALLDDEATVKRFYKENKRFRLQPENDAYEPIYTNEVHILGKVIALHRYF
ncbi:MAG: transcriptional repressor, LexA family [Clostridia bacterium]|jgi:repressor LexA|nr:transcriptional repressor, LexA family [Clostridia bacterium]